MKPTEEQEKILDYIEFGEGDLKINAYAGSGKCLGKDTPILMYDGEIKMVQDIQVGDVLMGPDSTPRNVLSTCSGRETLYKVVPVKGDSWVCNESHILSVKGTNNYEKGKIRDISVRDFLIETEDLYNKSGRRDRNWKLYRVGVDFDNYSDPELDPYYVGLYLGDGSRNNARVHSVDDEILNYLLSLDKKYDANATLVRPEGKCPYVDFRDHDNLGKAGSNKLLQFAKLFKHEKYVPRDYLINSREVRLKVLAGLLDSDGHLSGANTFEITTKYDNMKNDILFLARSLGFAAYSSKKYVKLKGWEEPRLYHRINISGNTETIPTLLPRKQAKSRKQCKDVLKTGFSLINLGVGDYYGFEIDGDRRFLLGDFTVTHNTTVLKMITESFPDNSFLYIAFNKAVADEAKKKFPRNCRVFTVHGLALTSIKESLGNTFFDRIKLRWKMRDYIKRYKIDTKLKHFITASQNEYDYLHIIKTLIDRFKNSDSSNFESFAKSSLSKGGYAKTLHNNKIIRESVYSIAKEMWEEEIDPKGKSPVNHNTYLKIWEMSDPVIRNADFILFDEAQDANPVMLSVIDKAVGPRKVYVGDKFQAIYGWNGAVNAMEQVECEKTLYLSQSWRFGEDISNTANLLLKFLQNDNHLPLRGIPNKSDTLGYIDESKQFSRIFRTNAALADYALSAIDAGKIVYVEGGVKELCNDLLDLYYLNQGSYKNRIMSSKYRPYKFIKEVMKEAKYDVSIKRDLQFVSKHGDELPGLMELLKSSVVDKRSLRRCNVICTTAHKSKGLEFDQVVLSDDFKLFQQEPVEGLPEQYVHDVLGYAVTYPEEINLLYVALTRAKCNLKLMPAFDPYIATINRITNE